MLKCFDPAGKIGLECVVLTQLVMVCVVQPLDGFELLWLHAEASHCLLNRIQVVECECAAALRRVCPER